MSLRFGRSKRPNISGAAEKRPLPVHTIHPAVCSGKCSPAPGLIDRHAPQKAFAISWSGLLGIRNCALNRMVHHISGNDRVLAERGNTDTHMSGRVPRRRLEGYFVS